MAAGFLTLIGYITPNGKFKCVNLLGEYDKYNMCWSDTERGINIKPTLMNYKQLQRVKNLVSGGSIIHVGATPSNTVYYKDYERYNPKYDKIDPVLYSSFEDATKYGEYVYCFDPDTKEWIFYEDDCIVDENGNFVDDYDIDDYEPDRPYTQNIYGESYRTNRKSLRESSNSALDNIHMYIDNINTRWPCKDGDLDIWDNGDGTYKIVIMDNRGRVVRDVIESQKPNYLVIDVKALYDILKIWND